jgi:hypothetical protein
VLHGVGDGEGDIGALGPVGFALPAGVGDHAAVGADDGDQAVALLVLDVFVDGLRQSLEELGAATPPLPD